VASQEFNVTKDIGKYFGSAMMVGFGIVAFYRWQQTQLIFFLLLVLRDFAAGYFFFKRSPAQSKGSLIPSMIAYVSSAMPLLYFEPTVDTKILFFVSDLLATIGFLIVVFATVELGTSIGISPANRGVVRTGIYRYITHPMYLGYVISETGLMLLNPLNLCVFAVSISFYGWRAFLEKKLLITSDTKNRVEAV
jgi:protein-S-isoprenylcysteine O-methyltransferase Ste14